MSDNRKNVKIAGEVYDRLKSYCDDTGFKIYKWVELAILEKLEKECGKNKNRSLEDM